MRTFVLAVRVVLAVVLISSCQVAPVTPAPLSAALPAIPAPPARGSAQLASELAELHAMRSVLSDAQREAIARWESGAVLSWNRIARELVSATYMDVLTASHVYALLSVAQYDALVAARTYQSDYNRWMPSRSAGGLDPLVAAAGPSYPSDHAALAAASAAVLARYFPGSRDWLHAQAVEQQEARLWAGVNCRSDIVAGDALGAAVAAEVLAMADTAQHRLHWDEHIPSGPGVWFISREAPALPMMPEWAGMRTWLLERPDQFRPAPPPAIDSPAFATALAEVRQIADTRSTDQLAIAKYWEGGAGTPTPPGHWNAIAAELLAAEPRTELETARVLALLNMALMDAGIAAWDAKYAYWLLRPIQADPAITMAVRLPPHPSYPSGHATFSGAAATFLGAVFPAERARLQAMAEEAAMSRVFGGIHYRFDGDAGLELGRTIGELAVAQLR